MPVFAYECHNKKSIHAFESYFSVSEIKQGADRPEKMRCPVCKSKVSKVVSIAVARVGKKSKWTGIDDTDELTFGKVAAEGKIPAEFNRKIKENKKKQKEFQKKDKEYKKRERELVKAREPIEIKS